MSLAYKFNILYLTYLIHKMTICAMADNLCKDCKVRQRNLYCPDLQYVEELTGKKMFYNIVIFVNHLDVSKHQNHF